jgi:phenylalanyl-tRNA synthetase beta chain
MGRKEQGVDFYDVKGDVEACWHLLQRCSLCRGASRHAPRSLCAGGTDWQVIGFVGELHPSGARPYDLAQAPVLFELDLNAVLQRTVPVFQPVAKVPAGGSVTLPCGAQMR